MSGATVSVKGDIRGLSAEIADMGKQVIDGATVRALNRTATTVRAEAARLIKDVYPGLKIATAKEQLTITRATKTTLRAIVTASGRSLPLLDFSARQTRAGVTVQVKGARKLIPHAFIATMRTGHRGVFIRSRSGGGRVVRLPIEELFSISLPAAFASSQIMDALVKVVKDRFPEAFEQEVRFLQFKKAA